VPIVRERVEVTLNGRNEEKYLLGYEVGFILREPSYALQTILRSVFWAVCNLIKVYLSG
jgi:hypothetical protein